jgi:hypothetical protein
MKRLVGRTDLEDALKRLEKLTYEEALMATTLALGGTHAVNEGLKGVAASVVGVADQVARVEDGVAIVNNMLINIDQSVMAVNEMVAEVVYGTYTILSRLQRMDVLLMYLDARVINQSTASDADQIKSLSCPSLISVNCGALHIFLDHQLPESIRRWLSPPDPSTNHNTARDTDHKRTASWFFRGSIFGEWKSKGSLLWIHGKRAPPFHASTGFI